MDTSTSITAPDSVFFRGQWHAATWLAEVVDESTGELVLTATVLEDGQGAPVVAALRMSMELARGLRLQAGLPPQFQVEARRMRARMRYVADVLRSARRMLDTPTVDEVDGLLLHAIGQLRMADGKDGADGSDEGRCYDCRTTGERLEELERTTALHNQRLNAVTKRLDALETKNASATVHLNQVPNAVKKITELDQLLQAVIKDCVDILTGYERWLIRQDDQLFPLADRVAALEDKLSHVAGAVVMDASVATMRKQEVHDGTRGNS